MVYQEGSEIMLLMLENCTKVMFAKLNTYRLVCRFRVGDEVLGREQGLVCGGNGLHSNKKKKKSL